jgi:hypothetical protein
MVGREGGHASGVDGVAVGADHHAAGEGVVLEDDLQYDGDDDDDDDEEEEEEGGVYAPGG